MTSTVRTRPEALKNRYAGLRHGQSEGNVQGVVVSDPKRGENGFGLTEEGRRQVERSVRDALERKIITGNVVVYTSDFLRAKETAEIAVSLIPGAILQYAGALRERSFGELEGERDTVYEGVWAQDFYDATHTKRGVESVASVADRMLRCISGIEKEWKDFTVLLVSHGDPLNILSAVWEGRCLETHRKLNPWQTAEVRLFSSEV